MCDGCENCICDAKISKWKISLYGTFVAFIIFNPMMYRCVNQCLPFDVANKYGCPKPIGFILHLVIFMLIIRSLM
jgi:hypothetical protein